MKKIVDFIKKLLGKSSDSESSSSGFTLIELLIVIAVIGILAAATLIAVDPIDRINAANDSRVQQAISALANGSETYAVTHNGFYANSAAILQSSGDIKQVPAPPTGYTAYAFAALPGSCTSGTTCTSVVITGQLKSKRYTSATTPVWRYESSTGKSCAVATATTACP